MISYLVFPTLMGWQIKIESLINAEYDDWTLINPFKSKDFSNI